MTAVVLARTYADAARAAGLLGLSRDWVYPHQAYLLNGLQLGLVVYVEGWTESAAITTDTLEALRARMTDDTPVERVMMREWGPGVVGVQRLEQPVADPARWQPEEEPTPRSGRTLRRWLYYGSAGLVGLAGVIAARLIGWL